MIGNRDWRTGLLRGPVIMLLFMLTVAPALSAANGPSRQAKETRTTILGVTVGTELERAERSLDRAAGENGDDEMRRREETGETEDEEEGGVKKAWDFDDGAFRSVALKAGRDGRVVWISGFVRPGHEIAFSELGDAATASRASDTEMIWNYTTADGNRRLVAKGRGGKASVISILSTDLPPVE